MADLYKGIAGSPITYLAADISANQTTISIADDSALPDAPNICTIGYGEHLETIKYETKSNGVLQNVTRGIEGTPQAWQAGTEVARFFTAYDHNSIIEDFVAHKAESASKHITESGSNTNGRYIKFDDGTMICMRSVNINLNTSSTHNFIFPASFYEVVTGGMVSLSSTALSTSYGAFDAFNDFNAMVDKANQQWRIRTTKPTSTSVSIDIGLFAVGRWKA